MITENTLILAKFAEHVCDCCVMLTNQSEININYGNRAYLRLGYCRYVFHNCRCGHHQLFPFYDLHRFIHLMEE